ncbi:carbohydrate-binding protein [Candidatus Epulonipiscioides saccharophilum]|nr:carbohydrate-binding protein [Epulopiscium sp. SCG-B10WGA-EpuloB]
MKISVISSDNSLKASISSDLGQEELSFVFEGQYAKGDKISFEDLSVPGFFEIKIDDTIDSSILYITESQFSYEIPFDEKKIAVNPKSFAGQRHYMRIKAVENTNYPRNIAKNTLDQHNLKGVFPHASANVETRGESVFAAYNAIDGIIANSSHGAWPYQSWGINRQDDAEIKIDFGRPVNFDEIVIYTRADFPHDNWWISAKLEFSDNTQEEVTLEKTQYGQKFTIKKHNISWIKMRDMIKSDDPSPFPALTQLEVYGY